MSGYLLGSTALILSEGKSGFSPISSIAAAITGLFLERNSSRAFSLETYCTDEISLVYFVSSSLISMIRASLTSGLNETLTLTFSRMLSRIRFVVIPSKTERLTINSESVRILTVAKDNQPLRRKFWRPSLKVRQSLRDLLDIVNI